MSLGFNAEQEELRQDLREELRRGVRYLQKLKAMTDRVERRVNRLEGRLTILSMLKAIHDDTSDMYDSDYTTICSDSWKAPFFYDSSSSDDSSKQVLPLKL